MIPSIGGLGDLDSSNTEPSLVPKDLESTVSPMELSGEESDGSPVYLTRKQVSETATCSGRECKIQSQEIEAYDSFDPLAVEEEESIGNMPEPGSFPDDSCNRLIGQSIKITVILGFGVLVLLTQKKEPRCEEHDSYWISHHLIM